MRVDKKCKIEKAVCKDWTRAQLTQVELDVKGKRLLATTGEMLAVVPCEVDKTDTNGPISCEALITARKATIKSLDKLQIDCNGELKIFPGPISMPRTVNGLFPPIDQVIPPIDRTDDRIIGVDVELLYTLCEAIGSTKVVLHIPKDPTDAIRVESNDGSGCFGVIMPMKI